MAVFYQRRATHPDEAGQTPAARLTTRLQYKDGHKTIYGSARVIFRSASFKTNFSLRTGSRLVLEPA